MLTITVKVFTLGKFLIAIAVIRLESRPPLKNEPKGTSERIPTKDLNLSYAENVPVVTTGHHDWRDPEGFPVNSRPWVLSPSAEAAVNGGLDVDVVYPAGFWLSNSVDEVRIECGGVEVDAIDATPTRTQKKQSTTLRPATPSSSK